MTRSFAALLEELESQDPSTPGITILVGDALERLRELPAESVQTCITSPPYWGLRDYGVEGQLGLEPSPEEYVSRLVSIFREVRRVLRPDATVWLNLGDSYRSKNLQGIPWKVAFALRDDHWFLRAEVIWNKPNAMPSSVTDRPTRSHEQIFLLSKSARYFYDPDAIREELAQGSADRYRYAFGGTKAEVTAQAGLTMAPPIGKRNLPVGRNKRSVWTISPRPFPGAHFATFPEALVEPCLLAGTSAAGACASCGTPWKRHVEQESRPDRPTAPKGKCAQGRSSSVGCNRASFYSDRRERQVFDDFYPACECGEQTTRPCLVLDPFCGAGTVGVVARKQGRAFVGVELNPDYAQMARERIEGRRSLRPA